jgi:hypothetical protein
VNLTPKALNALVDIKAELLSRLPSAEDLDVVAEEQKVRERTTQVMRPARVRGRSVQRMFRNMNERLARC